MTLHHHESLSQLYFCVLPFAACKTHQTAVSITPADEAFMREAILLSVESVAQGGGPFGAVIVKDGEIIASCSNSVTLDNDPTAHAEINAIRAACRALGTFDLDGCVIYASCEPCPMCLGAIYWAGIDRIYYANTRQDAEAIAFADNFIYEDMDRPMAQRNNPHHPTPPRRSPDRFPRLDRKGR